MHANAPGIVDEHYDPVWAQQQAALAAQQSATDAANQQRLNDFFNDQALHIVAAPIYALSGAVKEGVNGAKWLGHQILEGGRFQATKYAALGAAARGDLAGMEAADRLGAQIVADTTKPVAPVFHVSEFEHAAAIAVAPINPEEAAVAGMSFVERLASGLPGAVDLAAGVNVTRAGASADGIMAARGAFEATDGAISSTAASTADDLGIVARYEPGEVVVDEQRLVSNGTYNPIFDREVASQTAVAGGVDIVRDARAMAPFNAVADVGVDSLEFRSLQDPLLDSLGPAAMSHPEEYAFLLADLERSGVELRYGEKNISFAPNIAGGPIGNQIHLPEEFSISALRHEYGHFIDHQALGSPRYIEYFQQPELIVATERRQYLGGIRFAREVGDVNARRILIQNYLSERNAIVGKYYQRPYGGPFSNSIAPRH